MAWRVKLLHTNKLEQTDNSWWNKRKVYPTGTLLTARTPIDRNMNEKIAGCGNTTLQTKQRYMIQETPILVGNRMIVASMFQSFSLENRFENLISKCVWIPLLLPFHSLFFLLRVLLTNYLQLQSLWYGHCEV